MMGKDMRHLAIVQSAVLLLLGLAFDTLSATAGGEDGKILFEKRCGGCHALDKAKEGPPLRGVFGRTAGKIQDFPYSDALKGAQFSWDEATLDTWLTAPETLLTANDMAFRLGSKDERAQIIAYLKQLK